MLQPHAANSAIVRELQQACQTPSSFVILGGRMMETEELWFEQG
jgi:hypothetical protein